jgi:hypothetical protein
MYLRPEEWKLFSDLTWVHRDSVYETLASPEDNARFWTRFFSKIFAPRYKALPWAQALGPFDTTTPVLVSRDDNLHLPPLLEGIMYTSQNQTRLPVTFISRVPALVILLLVCFCYIILGGWVVWKREPVTKII